MIYKKEVLKSFLLKLTFLSLLVSSVFAYSGGTGQPNSPYQIASKVDLLALAAAPADYGKCFILTADINMAGQVFTKAIIAPDTSSSSGFQGTAFTGVFDGNSHKITHFTINGGFNNGYLALFGKINTGGSIKNLGLENFSISGYQYVGGLVGSNGGSISNCYSTGAVSGYQYAGGLVGSNGGSISNCYSTGTVSGNSNVGGSGSVGGLVGQNYAGGGISNCYSTGTVSGSSTYVGGLVGQNYDSSIISNCYSIGDVSGSSDVGGLVGGTNGGSISNCYSTGTVSGSTGSSYVGGLVGYNGGGSISASFWDVNTSGWSTSAGGTGKTTTQMQDANTFLNAGWDFLGETVNGTLDYWTQGSGQYPHLTWQTDIAAVPNVVSMTQADAENAIIVAGLVVGTRTGSYSDTVPQGCIISQSPAPGIIVSHGTPVNIVISLGILYSGGSGTTNDPYLIATAADMNTLGATSGNWNKCFKLVADINMAGQVFTMAIIAKDTSSSDDFQGTAFTGTFDGNGHKITNFTINGTGNSYLGLFGCIGSGSVKNLSLDNFTVSGSSGSIYVGGLAGYNNGNISNCYSTGTVTVTDTGLVGGLVGYSGGTISNCYSTGSVSGSWGVGGLAGLNYYGTISNCYSTGAVVSGFPDSMSVGGLVGFNNGGSITNCYATGAVSGKSYVGGLVGSNGGIIINCYSTGAVVSGSNGTFPYVGGLAGYNDGNISYCYSTGAVIGDCAGGGLVGYNYNNISYCYSTSTVSGSSYAGGLVALHISGNISYCYSRGAVSGSSYVGGLVGYSSDSTNNSFWDVNSSGQTTSDGGTGKTTTEMKTLSTFTSAGWDFTTPVWKMCDGTNYPKLSWQIPLSGDFVCPDGVDIYDLAVFTDQWLLKKLSFDSNGDHFVNFLDFAAFANNWDGDMNKLFEFSSQWLQQGAYNADIAPAPGGDGVVNFIDFALFAENWLKQI